ncbi:MAG: ribonuclease domain-containing protein [Acidimicrobiales bacterium]
MRRHLTLALAAAIVAATVVVGLVLTDSDSADAPGGVTSLPAITIDALPPEALDTLQLIRSEGPFPYDQDGAVFQNREGLLPERPTGYYHEFTVPTPGEDDRGARRLVVGDDGERFYTDDHYSSFREIVGVSP